MDERYDPIWIFAQALATFLKKPTILIEIKDAKDEYFILPEPGSILRGTLASAGSKRYKRASELFESRDLLGKVVVKYGREEQTFENYDVFIKHISKG